MKIKILNSAFAVILTVLLVANLPITVKAASNGVTELKPGKTVSTKLSDSKKHSVKYIENINKTTDDLKMTIYIDGKVKYTCNASWAFKASVFLLDVNVNTTLIYTFIFVGDEGTEFNKIFNYNNGYLKECSDIEYITGTAANPIPIKAGENKFIVNCGRQEPSIGCFKINASFKYDTSSKKVSKASSAYDIDFSDCYGHGYKPGEMGGWKDNWGTVSRSFNTYTKAGGNTLSFTSTKGERLKVQKVNIQKNAVYIQVMNEKGKTGWFKDLGWNLTKNYFLEALYAD